MADVYAVLREAHLDHCVDAIVDGVCISCIAYLLQRNINASACAEKLCQRLHTHSMVMSSLFRQDRDLYSALAEALLAGCASPTAVQCLQHLQAPPFNAASDLIVFALNKIHCGKVADDHRSLLTYLADILKSVSPGTPPPFKDAVAAKRFASSLYHAMPQSPVIVCDILLLLHALGWLTLESLSLVTKTQVLTFTCSALISAQEPQQDHRELAQQAGHRHTHPPTDDPAKLTSVPSVAVPDDGNVRSGLSPAELTFAAVVDLITENGISAPESLCTSDMFADFVRTILAKAPFKLLVDTWIPLLANLLAANAPKWLSYLTAKGIFPILWGILANCKRSMASSVLRSRELVQLLAASLTSRAESISVMGPAALDRSQSSSGELKQGPLSRPCRASSSASSTLIQGNRQQPQLASRGAKYDEIARDLVALTAAFSEQLSSPSSHFPEATTLAHVEALGEVMSGIDSVLAACSSQSGIFFFPAPRWAELLRVMTPCLENATMALQTVAREHANANANVNARLIPPAIHEWLVSGCMAAVMHIPLHLWNCRLLSTCLQLCSSLFGTRIQQQKVSREIDCGSANQVVGGPMRAGMQSALLAATLTRQLIFRLFPTLRHDRYSLGNIPAGDSRNAVAPASTGSQRQLSSQRTGGAMSIPVSKEMIPRLQTAILCHIDAEVIPHVLSRCDALLFSSSEHCHAILSLFAATLSFDESPLRDELIAKLVRNGFMDLCIETSQRFALKADQHSPQADILLTLTCREATGLAACHASDRYRDESKKWPRFKFSEYNAQQLCCAGWEAALDPRQLLRNNRHGENHTTSGGCDLFSFAVHALATSVALFSAKEQHAAGVLETTPALPPVWCSAVTKAICLLGKHPVDHMPALTRFLLLMLSVQTKASGRGLDALCDFRTTELAKHYGALPQGLRSALPQPTRVIMYLLSSRDVELSSKASFVNDLLRTSTTYSVLELWLEREVGHDSVGKQQLERQFRKKDLANAREIEARHAITQIFCSFLRSHRTKAASRMRRWLENVRDRAEIQMHVVVCLEPNTLLNSLTGLVKCLKPRTGQHNEDEEESNYSQQLGNSVTPGCLDGSLETVAESGNQSSQRKAGNAVLIHASAIATAFLSWRDVTLEAPKDEGVAGAQVALELDHPCLRALLTSFLRPWNAGKPRLFEVQMKLVQAWFAAVLCQAGPPTQICELIYTDICRCLLHLRSDPMPRLLVYTVGIALLCEPHFSAPLHQHDVAVANGLQKIVFDAVVEWLPFQANAECGQWAAYLACLRQIESLADRTPTSECEDIHTANFSASACIFHTTVLVQAPEPTMFTFQVARVTAACLTKWGRLHLLLDSPLFEALVGDLFSLQPIALASVLFLLRALVRAGHADGLEELFTANPLNATVGREIAQLWKAPGLTRTENTKANAPSHWNATVGQLGEDILESVPGLQPYLAWALPEGARDAVRRLGDASNLPGDESGHGASVDRRNEQPQPRRHVLEGKGGLRVCSAVLYSDIN